MTKYETEDHLQQRLISSEIKEKQKNLFPGAKFGLKFTREEKQFSQLNFGIGTVFSFVAATLFLVIIPYIHLDLIGSIWKRYTRFVNRTSCSCSCWDSTFKSNYEAGVPNYKHVYFNVTWNTLSIWIITVLFILSLYECIRKICHLYLSNSLRTSMLILFLVNIYPHYYSWWSYFNYLNDDFYFQWFHQLVFTVTEIISTVLVVCLLDQTVDPMPWKLVFILAIAISHAFISLIDQFGHNVLRGQGEIHQILRDIGFMIPDVFHVVVSLSEIKKLSKKRHVPFYFLITNRHVGYSVLFIISMSIFSSLF